MVEGSEDWQMGNTGVVLLAGALGELIRRPWKGEVLFERHLERQKDPALPLFGATWNCACRCVRRSWSAEEG